MVNSFNPLSIILNKNKLTEPNYIDWKMNLNIVLTAKEYKFVLTKTCLEELCLEELDEGATDKET